MVKNLVNESWEICKKSVKYMKIFFKFKKVLDFCVP